MKVFIVWGGDRAEFIAKTMSEWVKQVIQALDTFTSQKIESGVLWRGEISKELYESNVGLVCLTQDNLHNIWVHFEAGALSKNLNASKVCTFLYDIGSEQIDGPLSAFQHTKFEKSAIKKLLADWNKLIEKPLDPDTFAKSFDKNWPDLEKALQNVPSIKSTKNPVPPRKTDDILHELLLLTRGTHSVISELFPRSPSRDESETKEAGRRMGSPFGQPFGQPFTPLHGPKYIKIFNPGGQHIKSAELVVLGDSTMEDPDSLCYENGRFL